MSDESEIKIFKCLDFLRDNARPYAEAKANRIYLEEYRKTLKATLMKDAEIKGHKSAAVQEREAYAHDSYKIHLLGLQEALMIEEELRWKMIAAQAKIEVFRTLESSRRYEAKTI